MILYELLTGRLPFSGSGLAIAGQILTKTPLPPSTHRSDLDPALEAICLKAMAKAIGDRYTSMAELAAALTGFLHSPPASPTPTASSASPASPSPASGDGPQPAGSNSLVGQFLARLAGAKASAPPIPTPEPVAAPAPSRERRRPMWPMIVAAGVIGVMVLSAVIHVVTDNAMAASITKSMTQRAQPSRTRSGPIRRRMAAAACPQAPPRQWWASHHRHPRPLRPWRKSPPLPPVVAKTNTKGEFQPLFNGKDLTGWVTFPGKPGHWRVENGILTGSGADWSSLWTVRDDCRNFHLRVEARINKGGESGVFFRDAFPAKAYLAKLVGNEGKYQGSTGGLVSHTGKAIVPHRIRVVTPGEWFVFEVIADGDKHRHQGERRDLHNLHRREASLPYQSHRIGTAPPCDGDRVP